MELKALCRGNHAHLFFPPSISSGGRAGTREERAKASVRFVRPPAMRRYAIGIREPFGIWGGLTEMDGGISQPSASRDPQCSLLTEGIVAVIEPVRLRPSSWLPPVPAGSKFLWCGGRPWIFSGVVWVFPGGTLDPATTRKPISRWTQVLGGPQSES